jgi:hypothetical protein
MKMQILDVTERAEDVMKPSPRYAEVAATCRAMGLNIADNDYERIDDLPESNSVWTAALSSALAN